MKRICICAAPLAMLAGAILFVGAALFAGAALSPGPAAAPAPVETKSRPAGSDKTPAAHLTPELESACTEIRHIAEATPGAIVDMVEGTFFDQELRQSLQGCMIVIAGSWGELDENPSPTDAVFDYLSEQDWTQRTAYSADGPDGTNFTFCKGSVMCIVRGRWDGGDDADSTYVPSDVYQIVVYCVTIAPADCRPMPEE